MTKDNRVTRLNIRRNSRELTCLLALCKSEGRKPSEFVRELLRQEATKQGLLPTIEPAPIHNGLAGN
jgi:hypothetical protein